MIPAERDALRTAAELTSMPGVRDWGVRVLGAVVGCVDRGKKLGVKMMEALQRIGRQVGCYKVILDCSEDNVSFYTRCGFKQKEVQMAAYIPGNEQPRPRL